MCLGIQRNFKSQSSGRAGNKATPGPGHSFRLGCHVPSLPLLVHPFFPSWHPSSIALRSFSCFFLNSKADPHHLYPPSPPSSLNITVHRGLPSMFLSSESWDNLIRPSQLVQCRSKPREVEKPLGWLLMRSVSVPGPVNYGFGEAGSHGT